MPAKTGLESDLQGSDITLTRRGAGSGSSVHSSGGSSSQASSSATLHAKHREHSTRRFRSVDVAVEYNPKAGLDTFVRRLCSNPAPAQCLTGRMALFRGDEAAARPGIAIAGRRGLAQSATAPSRPATSGSGRESLRPLPTARSTSSHGSITPERSPSRDSSGSRASVKPKAKGTFFRPLTPENAFQPSAMAHRRSAHVAVKRTSITDLTRQG